MDEGQLASMGWLSSGDPLEGRWYYVCRADYPVVLFGIATLLWEACRGYSVNVKHWMFDFDYFKKEAINLCSFLS